MADTVEINVSVNADDAIGPINELKSAIAGVSAPLAAMQDASAQAAQAQQQWADASLHATLQATRAMEQADASYVAVFKNGMQVLVASKQLTLQQALGYDIDYSAQVIGQEQERLAAIRDSDQASVEDRKAAIAMMQELDARYIAQASAEYRQMADAARSQADRVGRSYEGAFNPGRTSRQRTFNEILTGQTTWAQGMTRMVQEVETFFLDEI